MTARLSISTSVSFILPSMSFLFFSLSLISAIELSYSDIMLFSLDLSIV